MLQIRKTKPGYRKHLVFGQIPRGYCGSINLTVPGSDVSVCDVAHAVGQHGNNAFQRVSATTFKTLKIMEQSQ